MDLELTCPLCGGIVPAQATDADQYSACKDCQRPFKITYDAEQLPSGQWRSHYYFKPLDPPTDMDLYAAAKGI